MKKYAFFIFLLTFIVLFSSIFANGEVIPVSIQKIALKYEGEDYRVYDITPSVNWDFNDSGVAGDQDAVLIATLTDEANSLPAGVITEIKLYVHIDSDPDINGWLTSEGTGTETKGDAMNFLDSNVDLSTIKRKNVTCRIYAAVEGNPVTSTHTEENL